MVEASALAHGARHVCGILLVVVLLVLERTSRRSPCLLVLWNLPGVILHEGCHLVAGLLFGARPTSLSLIPRREGSRWTLGSVRFRRITPLNALPVALAPLLLLPAAFYTWRHWFSWFPTTFPATLALYGVLFLLCYNALPSRQDLRVACNWRSVALYTGLAAVAGAATALWPPLREFCLTMVR